MKKSGSNNLAHCHRNHRTTIDTSTHGNVFNSLLSLNLSEIINQKKLAEISINVHRNPYLIHIKILLNDVSFINNENSIETMIRTIKVINVCFHSFQYCLIFLNQRIITINKNNNHNHSRNNAGNDDQHNCNQYTAKVAITWYRILHNRNIENTVNIQIFIKFKLFNF